MEWLLLPCRLTRDGSVRAQHLGKVSVLDGHCLELLRRVCQQQRHHVLALHRNTTTMVSTNYFQSTAGIDTTPQLLRPTIATGFLTVVSWKWLHEQ